jgi:hypothetical protein
MGSQWWHIKKCVNSSNYICLTHYKDYCLKTTGKWMSCSLLHVYWHFWGTNWQVSQASNNCTLSLTFNSPDDSSKSLCNISKLLPHYGVTYLRTVPFTVTDVRTSNLTGYCLHYTMIKYCILAGWQVICVSVCVYWGGGNNNLKFRSKLLPCYTICASKYTIKETRKTVNINYSVLILCNCENVQYYFVGEFKWHSITGNTL